VNALKCLHAILLFVALVAPSTLWAVEPSEMLADPTLEARARTISKELRCMVCQNESIDDSEAPLAHDIRVLVRQRLKDGDSNQQVLDFLVARYGEFVLLKPPLSWHTVALWGMPPAVLLVGIVMIAIVLRRRGMSQTSDDTANLTPAEEARLAELLRGGGAQ
jgi:cytochrome c-type biogenesis protein CcmH